MIHESDDGTNHQTRRQILRSTVVSTVTVAGLAGAVSAADGDEPSDAAQEVLDQYNDQDELIAAFERQPDIIETIREHDLVEGEDRVVRIHAREYEGADEPKPEYHVVRDTPDGGHMTVALQPDVDLGYVLHGHGGHGDHEITCDPLNTKSECREYCKKDSCRFCRGPGGHCGCWCSPEPCTPYCCYECTCKSSCDCEGCDPVEPIEVESSWFEELMVA